MKKNKVKKGIFVLVVFILASCASNQSNQQTANDSIIQQNEDTTKITDIENNLPAIPKKYTWQFGICEYTGTFDANKFSKEELDNTVKYMIYGEGTTKSTMIFSIGDVEKINRDEIDSEFEKSLKKVSSVNFVKTDSFGKLRQRRIDEIKRLQKLTLMEIDSYKNPAVLKNDNYSKNECSKYTNALIEGGDALLAVWKEMADKGREEGNKSAWERYENESSTPQKMEYARVHVTTFGWWNCINNSIERVDSEQANEMFKKLFIDLKIECEEP